MEESQTSYQPHSMNTSVSSRNIVRRNTDANATNSFQGPGFPGRKKRGHGSRSWIEIDQYGNSKTLELDKAALMRYCSLPARDLRLLDPLFIYPSAILGREKAIVVNLEQIRCIITADEVILMNSLDGCVVQYKSELCKRIQNSKDQAGNDITFLCH